MMSYPPILQCTRDHIYSSLNGQLLPPVVAALEMAAAGQRIRVTTLPGPVMEGICQALQGDSRWVARVLVGADSDFTWQATATKLIELRNTLEKPLIVFIPPGLRTAAEDSLDIATFKELNLSAAVTGMLIPALMKQFPETLRNPIGEIIAHVRREKWTRNDDELVKYLLTIHLNGNTAEAVGAALFCFGMVPHFGLMKQANMPYWLSRNHKMQQLLADVRQPLQARISRLPLEPNSIQARLFTFLRERVAQDPHIWAPEIACDTRYQELALDSWLFTESGEDSQLRIKLEPLTLPMQSADEVAGTTPLPVLNLDGRESLKISFRATPAPSEVPEWKTYRVQLLLVDGDQPTVAWESNGFKKPASRQKATRTLKVGDLQGLEEGTYFVRVDGYDQDGAVLTQPKKLDPMDPHSRGENESDYFLVVRKDVEIVPATPRAIEVPSFLVSWVEANIRSITAGGEDALTARDAVVGTWAEPLNAPIKGEAHFRLEGDGFAGFTISVPSLIRRLEATILENPDQLGRYQLNFAKMVSGTEIEIRRAPSDSYRHDESWKEFLLARERVFSAVLKQHEHRLGNRAADANCFSIVEVADTFALTDLIQEYGRQYLTLVSGALNQAGPSKANSALFQVLASLDVTEVRWRPTAGDLGRALLLSPTHPLRMLWHLQHSALCDSALKDLRDKTTVAASWSNFLRQLASEILPINLPMVLFDRRGRAYVEQGLLTSHWSLFLPDKSERLLPVDATGSRETCRRLLGIRKLTPTGTAITSDEIARRAFEYVQQHPYVEQLKINVFNPGDGQVITDALRKIEARRLAINTDGAPPPLRYSIQMFASQSQVETMGEAFESLLDPERQVAEDDEFTLTSSNHLLPKLIFARNMLSDFVQNPENFSAHLSILIEQFGSQARLGQIGLTSRGSFVGGLIQEPETSLGNMESGFGWYKALRPSVGNNANVTERLLIDALSATQQIQAASATGEANSPDVAPLLALHLDHDNQTLLRVVHDYSDWVVIIDKNLGLEYFDSPTAADDAGYLLDYAPEFLQEDRQRILLTTRSSIELQSLIRPTIENLGLKLPVGSEAIILNTLRSLSGRLALKLFSIESNSAEVVGLLLARWLLGQSQLLADRVLIPLDVHRAWFNPTNDDLRPNRRADLLLVGLDRSRKLIRCQAVEVKLREELTSAGRVALYRDMHEQAQATEKRVRELFDPHLYSLPRADLPVISKELTTALSFYLRRAARYQLLAPDVLHAGLEFVENLDSGFSLDLSSIGVVFERQGVGTHIDEDEPGFTVHRFGLDVAQNLIFAACGVPAEVSVRANAGSSSTDSRPMLLRTVAQELLRPFRSSVEGSYTAGALSEEQRPDDQHLPTQSAPTSSSSTPSAGADQIPTSPNSPATIQQQIAEQGMPANPEQLLNAPVEVGNTDSESKKASKERDKASVLTPAVLLGSHEITPQFGILGRHSDASVAIDLTGCNTISLFGVQGFGKSYTLGVIAEMATTQVEGINVLPAPLATVIFHYHKSDAYAPEFAVSSKPNNKVREIDRLLKDYGARPHGLDDIVLLAPEAKLEQRRKEFPGLEVHPIKFSSGELGTESWKFLLGAYGNDSLYVRQLIAIMRRHREDLTLRLFREEILAADLAPQVRRLAEDRLNLAEPYVDDSASLGALIRPGRTIIVDLRDPWIEKDEALGLFVVMMRIFAATRHEGHSFNKLVIFDEAHKYISESELISQVVETIREMRHQATSIVIASQDPLSVPRSVIELTSVLILHRMTSPQWLKHLKTAITALDDLSEGQLAALQAGDALVWAQRSTDKRFTQRPYKIQIRPRFSLHGGGTKTAVPNETVR
jgi:DNA phosphorothioation-dependent restriction protein DptH